MITIFRGLPGSGKTYFCALTILKLIRRNKSWYKKGWTSELRPIACNFPVSDWVKKIYPAFILWDDLEQLVKLKGADIIFDDMSNYLNAQRWAETPMSVKRWLSLHEHYGCEFYGNAQDFMTIDPSVRRLTTELYDVKKIMGSPRPGLNKPPVKHIWGILIKRRLDIEGLKMQTSIDESTIPSVGLIVPRFIRKEICSVFDTNQDFSDMKWPMLHHVERFCADENCEYHHKPVIKHS